PFSTTHPVPLLCTLFPYTTLFRSERDSAVAADIPGDGDIATAGVECQSMAVQVHGASQTVLTGRRASERLVSRQRDRQSHNRHSDRKSTRLNSSHQIISYAVFCLK